MRLRDRSGESQRFFEWLILLGFVGFLLASLPPLIKQAIGKDPCRDAHGARIEACFAADDCERGRGTYSCFDAGEFALGRDAKRAAHYFQIGCRRGEAESCDELKLLAPPASR